jgi:hypothetical protein
VVPTDAELPPSLLAMIAPDPYPLLGVNPVHVPPPSLIVPLWIVAPLVGFPSINTPPTKLDDEDVQYVTVNPFKFRSVLLPPTVKHVPAALTFEVS